MAGLPRATNNPKPHSVLLFVGFKFAALFFFSRRSFHTLFLTIAAWLTFRLSSFATKGHQQPQTQGVSFKNQPKRRSQAVNHYNTVNVRQTALPSRSELRTATSRRSPRGGKTTLDQRRHREAKDIVCAEHRAENAEGAGSKIMQATQVEVTIQTITTAEGAETRRNQVTLSLNR